MRVWLPYDDLVARLGPNLVADIYDGIGTPPPTHDEVELYVAPYTFDRTPLEQMRSMGKLRVVQTLTAGIDHVLPYLPDGVQLCNAGHVHDASTAELAVALILASLRGVPDFVRGQDLHEWRHARHDALADRTVLIIGYGGVGSAVDRRLAGFEVTVERVARRARAGVHAPSELPRLLPKADVVVLALPLTADTTKLVNAEFLAMLPDGALLVNVARGKIIDTSALLAEVRAGRLRAALDVADGEPLAADDPLWNARGLLVTPHVGGDSSAFLPRAKKLIVSQLDLFAAGKPLLYNVTP